MKNIDIEWLRAFLSVYESGSFSHAAKQLGKTQSSISQQIKKLEDLLGRDVFTRTNRSVHLATEGEILLPYARKMIAMNDEICGRIGEPHITGTVKIGSPEAFATYHLPDILVQFSKSHPDVALEVQCDLSHNLVDHFKDGALDIILFKKDRTSRLNGTKVWRESLVWAGQDKDQLKNCDMVPLILSPAPCVYRNKMIEALEEDNIAWTPVFTSSNMTNRIAAARAGLGVTLIPKEMLATSHGLTALGESAGLPAVPAIEVDLMINEEHKNDAATRLAEHITFTLEHNPSIKKTA
jgi:DNA-binding transcriptional LysR family regulator